MPISRIPIFSMLRTKMQWHQERLLAENVSNVDTPDLKPRDLAPALHAAVEIAPEHCKAVAEVIGHGCGCAAAWRTHEIVRNISA